MNPYKAAVKPPCPSGPSGPPGASSSPIIRLGVVGTLGDYAKAKPLVKNDVRKWPKNANKTTRQDDGVGMLLDTKRNVTHVVMAGPLGGKKRAAAKEYFNNLAMCKTFGSRK